MSGSSDFQRLFQVWALSLLAALYLFRGMLEFPSTGWRPQTILTVVVGLVLLPTLATLAATTFSWRRSTITALCALGSVINASLLVALWNGLTLIASLTLLIVALYASVTWVEVRRGSSKLSNAARTCTERGWRLSAPLPTDVSFQHNEDDQQCSRWVLVAFVLTAFASGPKRGSVFDDPRRRKGRGGRALVANARPST
jgi:hypothetical protein